MDVQQVWTVHRQSVLDRGIVVYVGYSTNMTIIRLTNYGTVSTRVLCALANRRATATTRYGTTAVVRYDVGV